jgi:DNA-binding beta-propeller fold protein YncE
MRIPTPIQALSAAAALALLAGCSSGSAIAPTMSTPQGHVHTMGHGSSVLNPVGMLKLSQHPITQSHRASFFACSTTARLEYVSDASNGAVDIFQGGFTAGQTPCGLITGLSEPQGLAVRQGKLYVANTTGFDILRFPRGSTTPDKTYTDSSCGGEYPADVAVDSAGYVYATDIISNSCSGGQMSTWKPGGTFLHNYPAYNGANEYFLTVQKNGATYYDDNAFAIESGSCVAGVCGAFASTGATMAFPGGLRSASDQDVVLDDQSAAGGGALTTFESFPTSTSSCPLGASDPVSYDFNHRDKHAYYADAGNFVAGEVKYSDESNTCAAVATVAMPGQPIGVAVDAPGPL